MSALSLNTVNEIMQQYYLPALAMARDEQRLYMERQYGMYNPMPFFDWWPWLTKAIAAPADAKSRLHGAWRVLRVGEL